ncbi:MAG: S49 family peptidase, partial [Bacteroidota bacterium]
MKRILLILITGLLWVSHVYSQNQTNQSEKSFISYYGLNDFYQAAPEAFKFGLYGFGNPAMTSYLHDQDFMISLSSSDLDGLNINRWGIFSGSHGRGYGALTLYDDDETITDYRYSFSFGDRSFSLGLGYGFVGGDKSHFGRSNIFTWGALIRPFSNLSLAVHQTVATENSDYESVGSIAIRPIGDYPLAIFGDYAMYGDENLEAGRWSAGVSWEVLDGIRLNTRYFNTEALSVGLDISFGQAGISAQGLTDTEQELDMTNYTFRFGDKDRTILDIEDEPEHYVILDLKGKLTYTSTLFFGNDKTFLDMLRRIENAKKHQDVKGVLVNTSGMQINYEMLWEIRQELLELKNRGKEVIVFVDRMGIQGYHLASVADKIIMDPMGTISLTGYALGRSYYKNMLEKVDIGFQEFRYYEYKSAAESFSRDGMSEADSIQRQAIVDGWMNTARTDISVGRGFSPDKFNQLVNSTFIYHADEALEAGLCDSLSRWYDLVENMKTIGDKNGMPGQIETDIVLDKPRPYDDEWGGKQDMIAVIYAEGICAMESGINARELSENFKSAAENPFISAIVLRVDSPGGDAMASDYIARLVRQYKDKKPIIVSQGFVAASGGYWLSMDAEKIYTSPITITGSIGVISSFFYDDGIQEDLGISTDIVQNGEFADLGY